MRANWLRRLPGAAVLRRPCVPGRHGRRQSLRGAGGGWPRLPAANGGRRAGPLPTSVRPEGGLVRLRASPSVLPGALVLRGPRVPGRHRRGPTRTPTQSLPVAASRRDSGLAAASGGRRAAARRPPLAAASPLSRLLAATGRLCVGVRVGPRLWRPGTRGPRSTRAPGSTEGEARSRTRPPSGRTEVGRGPARRPPLAAGSRGHPPPAPRRLCRRPWRPGTQGRRSTAAPGSLRSQLARMVPPLRHTEGPLRRPGRRPGGRTGRSGAASRRCQR
mmetsp:Transcript_76697/g.165989  ORF Transcript_76697/g.165989 Transcript_76697/m.165989 type:complete len:274 (+) Transcript_76697:192-1013(+)